MTNTNATRISQLIKELLANPVDFENRGRGNELLEFHCNELLDSIRPLLSHPNDSVRGTAMFVANELGIGSRPLIDAVIPLMNDVVPRTAYDAMESVFLCATDVFADRFVFVVEQLEYTPGVLRQSAMELISKASVSQLYGAKTRCGEIGNSAQIHEKCLQSLIESKVGEIPDVHEMLDSDTELVRLYGVVIAKRIMSKCPKAIEYAAANTNLDVRQFALESKGVK